jgi:hypothetical protein
MEAVHLTPQEYEAISRKTRRETSQFAEAAGLGKKPLPTREAYWARIVAFPEPESAGLRAEEGMWRGREH